jgi:hypothetical protein
MRKVKVSRRGFLQQAAAAGSISLLGSRAHAGPVSPASVKDIAIHDLATSPVEKVPWRVQPFSMTQVRLLPSYWKDMMELNRGFLYALPNDRLLYNFRVTAGLPTNADPLGGWESPDCEVRGHYVGHYMSACALLHASTGDEFIRAKADALVAGLAECQFKEGYLGAYPTSFYDRLRSYQTVWAPFYTYHKLLAGLIDMYEHTGNRQALTVALRMADWADRWTAAIPPDDFQKILLVEHGGMNESFFNLYAITGNARYRDAAFRFEHKKIFDPLANNQDILAGNHANTNIPKIIGAARGYELTDDARYRSISQNFYRMVVSHHIYCTGGTSNDETWHAPDAISTHLGPSTEECCCSYNMMKLSRHLYGQNSDPAFFDYYERLLLNVRYGTQERNGMLMYYVPLGPGLYKCFGTLYNSFWCCTGTGSEEYAKLNDSIYFHDDDAVYVNLFIPSTLNWAEGLSLKQTTSFPNEETVTFVIAGAPRQRTALKLRVPYYAEGATVKINGQPRNVSAVPSSYITLSEPWKTGDIVEFTVPLRVHINSTPDNPKIQAAMYGPLVLAALLGTEGLTTSMIYADSGRRNQAPGYGLPQVAAKDIWAMRVEGSKEHPLCFRTTGSTPPQTLVPLNQVMDERYSVYFRNTA